MRALVLALLVVVPSLAGEEDSLSKAVELFHSKDAAAREQGSLTAAATLKKLLAPLLKALEDKDPEVRRRARRVILGLVPGELEKEKQQLQQQQQQLQVIRLALLNQLRRVKGAPLRLAGKPEQLPRVDVQTAMRRAAQADSRELVHQFGLTTRPFKFEVLTVIPQSRAARLGLVKGDIVVRVNRTVVKTITEFAAVLGPKKEWDRLRLRVRRRGEWLNLPIVR